jgi:hypothetical protein
MKIKDTFTTEKTENTQLGSLKQDLKRISSQFLDNVGSDSPLMRFESSMDEIPSLDNNLKTAN